MKISLFLDGFVIVHIRIRNPRVTVPVPYPATVPDPRGSRSGSGSTTLPDQQARCGLVTMVIFSSFSHCDILLVMRRNLLGNCLGKTGQRLKIPVL
jgi:hypothetical protein